MLLLDRKIHIAKKERQRRERRNLTQYLER